MHVRKKPRLTGKGPRTRKSFVHHTENPQFFLNGNGEKISERPKTMRDRSRSAF